MESLIVTQPELARIFGVHVRTIQRWGDDGLDEARVGDRAPPVVVYDLPAAVAWRLELEAERLGPDGPGVDLDRARARKELALAGLRELELATRRGELVSVEDMDSTIRETLQLGNRALKAAPTRLARRWAQLLDVSEARAIELVEQVVEDVRAILRAIDEQEGGNGTQSCHTT